MMTSIRLIAYTYVYGIIIQVYKIRRFPWHTLTYTDHDTDLIRHATNYIFRIPEFSSMCICTDGQEITTEELQACYLHCTSQVNSSYCGKSWGLLSNRVYCDSTIILNKNLAHNSLSEKKNRCKYTLHFTLLHKDSFANL